MSTQDARQPRVFLLDGQALRGVRDRAAAGDDRLAPAIRPLLKQAEEALALTPPSVMDKPLTPPSGDKHDYMSMGPYWWPNPNSPDGLPYVRRDGEVNPEGDALDRAAMGRMRSAVCTLALAYYLTGREAFAEHAATLLRTWFIDPATRMNPHLEYGQGIPGRCDGRGIGIIDTSHHGELLDAVGMLAGSGHWGEKDQYEMVRWHTQYLDWLLVSDHGKDEFRASNNHGTWYDVQAAAMALFVDNRALAARILVTVPMMRLAEQIAPDGRQPGELSRTRSLSYSTFNLAGLMFLALLGEHVNMDFWNYRSDDGRGIRKALDWLVPYMEGRTWPFQQIKPIDGGAFVPLLRLAAINYDAPVYEEVIDRIPGVDAASHRANLLYPR